jgi:cytochrome c-type biogenesis protein CcmH/NrfG
VVAGGALLLAAALESPVGEGERDAARPAVPGAVADPSEGLAEGLPPLTLIVDRALPPAIAALPPIRQAQRLEALATSTGEAGRYVELGSVLQTLGDGAGATAAYRSALRAGGSDLEADTGLAMVEATRGGDGPARAAERLEALARANPSSQVVAFNQGWLAIYRRDADTARASWERTVALDSDARLGRVARALLASLEQSPAGRNP